MPKQPLVDILLATYNGEKFLQEQLDSIAAQEHGNWRLLIRDDASTDKTMEIIRSFASNPKYKDKVFIIDENEPRNKEGSASACAARNFSRLMEVSQQMQPPADYMGFCDQDDIWDKRKVSLSLEKLQSMEAEKSTKIPLMVHGNFGLFDQDGATICDSYDDDRHANKGDSPLARLLVQCPTTGFTILMNRSLLNKALPVDEGIHHHDIWCSMVARATGDIGYLYQPLAKYRQHAANVSGQLTEEKNIAGKFGKKLLKGDLGITRVLEDKTRLFHEEIETMVPLATTLLVRFEHEMRPKDIEMVNGFLELPYLNRGQRLASMIRHGLLPSNPKYQNMAHRILAESKNDSQITIS